MKTIPNKYTEDKILELCGELHPEDGISSKELIKREQAKLRKRERRKPNHHQEQLCKQVQQVIDMAIACDCGDPILDDLTTLQVQTVSKSNSLEITFTTSVEDLDRITVMHETLCRVEGLLRASVAGNINRKRVPHLRFKIILEELTD